MAAAAQANPFTGRSPGGTGVPVDTPTPARTESVGDEEEKTVPDPAAGRGPSSTAGTGFFYRLPFQQELIGYQRRLNSGLAGFIRELRESPSPALLFSILGISFLYGFLHALLPGHRKMILFGYFIAEEARPAQGIAAGLGLAILHAAASVIIIGSVYLVLKGAATISGSFENANAFIQTASAWLLLAAGSVLLFFKIREAAAGHRDRGHTHDKENRKPASDAGENPAGNEGAIHGFDLHQGDDHGGRDRPSRGGRRRMLPFIIFSGMIPCPGASMILMFSLSLGVFYIGLLSVAAMSAGMAVTLVSVSVLTILLKEKALRLLSGNGGHKLHTLVELGGAGFLFAFGLWLVVFMPPLG
jgi:ABC-type nickel/cobalt efflux system permease component RcnA